MYFYFAPLEGLTSAIFRYTHHQFFPGIDKYFTPFLSPTQHPHFTAKQLRELTPAYHKGLCVIPQLLTKRAEDFIWSANALQQLGFPEVNLNLGCPSGTVTAKGKGAGFLGQPEALDRFLDAIFSAVSLPISIKTRLGMKDPAEFNRLMEIYNQYPILELTIHPRLRQDFYRGHVRMDCFTTALPLSRAPVCYNGDLVTTHQIQHFAGVPALMIGRGLVADPGLVVKAITGQPIPRATYQAFHDALFTQYLALFGDARIAIERMKEFWFYHIHLFENGEKLLKQIRKTSNPAVYMSLTATLYESLPLRKDAVAGWFQP